ncbi:MAG: hypothetical protein AAF550_10015, partial [Myxococcota bacterium]
MRQKPTSADAFHPRATTAFELAIRSMAKHTRDEDAVFELVKSNAYDQHRSSLHAYLFLKLHDGDTANQAMSQLIQSARSAGCTELLA